jgi:hypothetical protein
MNITGERRLLFVGSGLSTQLGMYSWEGLFNEIAKGRPVENDIRQLVARGNAYAAAADRLSAHLGRVLLENEIRSLIRKCQRSISKEQANSWIVPLSKIATGGAIVTTNWDTLLPDITGWDPLRWPEDRARVGVVDIARSRSKEKPKQASEYIANGLVSPARRKT